MDAAGPQLKVISQIAVGFDNIDVPEATRRGIPVGNTPEVLTKTTADAAFALLVLDSRVRPAGMDTRWLASFSPQQKQQWLEFAVKLEVAVSGCSRFVDAITEPANAESAMVLPADWVNDGAELPLEEPS